MQEYARVCQSMPEYTRVYQSIPEYAIFAQRLNAMSYSWFQTGHKKIRKLAFLSDLSLIIASRSHCCVLLALSWNKNEYPSTDKLSRAINKIIAWSCQWLTHPVLLRLNWETMAVENVNAKLVGIVVVPMLVSTEGSATVWWQLCSSLATAFHSLDTVFYLIKTQS